MSRPEVESEPLTLEQRLRRELGEASFVIFDGLKRFRLILVAVPRDGDQFGALIVRRDKTGFVIQQLETAPTHHVKHIVASLKGANITLLPYPRNPTQRGKIYRWEHLVPKKQLDQFLRAEGRVINPQGPLHKPA